MPLHVSSTVVLIVRRSKLYHTASGIITLVGGRPVLNLCTAYAAITLTTSVPTRTVELNL